MQRYSALSNGSVTPERRCMMDEMLKDRESQDVMMGLGLAVLAGLLTGLGGELGHRAGREACEYLGRHLG